jgi:hypothetical protein
MKQNQFDRRRHAHGGGGAGIVVGLFHSGAGGDHGDLNPNERRLLQASSLCCPREAAPLPAAASAPSATHASPLAAALHCIPQLVSVAQIEIPKQNYDTSRRRCWNIIY